MQVNTPAPWILWVLGKKISWLIGLHKYREFRHESPLRTPHLKVIVEQWKTRAPFTANNDEILVGKNERVRLNDLSYDPFIGAYNFLGESLGDWGGLDPEASNDKESQEEDGKDPERSLLCVSNMTENTQWSRFGKRSNGDLL